MCYPCFAHSQEQPNSLSEVACCGEKPGSISSSSSCAVTKQCTISPPCLGRLRPFSQAEASAFLATHPKCKPSLCACYLQSTPPVKLSPQSSTSAAGWHLPKAVQSLMAEPVLSGDVSLPCLWLAGRQRPPSQHLTAGGTQLRITYKHELQKDKRKNSNDEHS